MPHRITQCNLSPSSGDFPDFTPVEAGTRFSDPGVMQGWAHERYKRQTTNGFAIANTRTSPSHIQVKKYKEYGKQEA